MRFFVTFLLVVPCTVKEGLNREKQQSDICTVSAMYCLAL